VYEDHEARVCYRAAKITGTLVADAYVAFNTVMMDMGEPLF